MEAIRSFEHEGKQYVAVDYSGFPCHQCVFVEKCESQGRVSLEETALDCDSNYPPNKDYDVIFVTEVDYLKHMMRQA
jgi:hypothetical protein